MLATAPCLPQSTPVRWPPTSAPDGGTYRIQRGDLLDYIASARTKQSGRPKARRTASTFQKLDGERLLRAWREQGVD